MRALKKIEKASIVYDVFSRGGIIHRAQYGVIMRMFPSGMLGILRTDEILNDALGDGSINELLAKDLYIFERKEMTMTEFADMCDELEDKAIREIAGQLGRKLT